uniref:Uncharacterized protein n=1 Tax=Vespula pensylvanica TaxID=30213 RepID=A0A834UFQ3_VESPE|nr:hypothetical protein H0235_003932 [Vespula pensylvanica]
MRYRVSLSFGYQGEKETERRSRTKYELWQGRKLVLRRGLAEGGGVVGREKEAEPAGRAGRDTVGWGDRQDWLFRNVKLSSTLPPTHVVRT